MNNEYYKGNRSFQSEDKSKDIDYKLCRGITRVNMNEIAEYILGSTKIHIEKMNESSTMFPVIVTLMNFQINVFFEVFSVSISKLVSS